MFKLDSLGLHDINSKCARFATIARSRGLGFFFLTTSTYPGGGDDGIRGGGEQERARNFIRRKVHESAY